MESGFIREVVLDIGAAAGECVLSSAAGRREATMWNSSPTQISSPPLPHIVHHSKLPVGVSFASQISRSDTWLGSSRVFRKGSSVELLQPLTRVANVESSASPPAVSPGSLPPK